MQISVKELVELIASVSTTTTTELSCIKESTMEISHKSDSMMPISNIHTVDYSNEDRRVNDYCGNIGENVRLHRENAKLTQDELSAMIGVNRSMLAQIERGSKSLSLPLAVDLAEALKCQIEDFLR